MEKKSAVLGMAAAAAAFSGASFSALAGPCVGTKGGSAAFFTSFLPGGVNAGCTLLDKTITGVSQNNIAEGVFLLTPVTATNNPGFSFGFNTILSAANGASFIFSITAPASDPITDASLAIVSVGTGSSLQVSEMLSNGSSLSASSSQTVSKTFGATTSLTVTNTITTTGNAVPSQGFTEQFSETPVTAPEPSSLALLGVGLSAFGLTRRRKHS